MPSDAKPSRRKDYAIQTSKKSRSNTQPDTTSGDTYELHLDAIARDGRAAAAGVRVFDVQTGAIQAIRYLPGDSDEPCTSEKSDCVEVPPGTYSVMGFVYTMPADMPSTEKDQPVLNTSLVGTPEMRIDDDTQYTLDARRAREVTIDTPDHPRAQANAGGALQLGMRRTAANGVEVTEQVHESPGTQLEQRFFMQPTKQVTVGDFSATTRWRLEEPDIELASPRLGNLHPRYYHKTWFSDKASQYPFFDGKSNLRVVDVGAASGEELQKANLNAALALIRRSDDVSVAKQSNAAADAGARFVAIYNDGPGVNGDPGDTGTKLQVPTVFLPHKEGVALRDLSSGHEKTKVRARGEKASPYLYDLLYTEQDAISKRPHHVADRRKLASVKRHFDGQPTQGSTYSEASYAFQPFEDQSITTTFPLLGGPRTRTDYHLGDSQTRWSFAVTTPESKYNNQFPESPVARMELGTPSLVKYEPKQRNSDEWGAAPIAPGINPRQPLERSGDQMRVHLSAFRDADGNYADGATSSFDDGLKTSFRVYADDDLLTKTTHLPTGVVPVPKDEARYRIDYRVDNDSKWAQMSRHSETHWTFRSRHVSPDDVSTEPLLVPEYDVDTDLRNRVAWPGRGKVTFGLRLRHQGESAAAAMSDVSVSASGDDGDTWHSAHLKKLGDGRYRVTLPGQATIRRFGSVSLKVRAADRDDNTLRQEITRAFQVGKRPR